MKTVRNALIALTLSVGAILAPATWADSQTKTPVGKYLVSVIGFVCHNEAWDDAFNWDGKNNEVFIAVGYKRANKSGTILHDASQEPEQTPVMGDTWNQPNRVQAGSASDRGGIISGDKFPTSTPWLRSRPLQDDKNWPPYKVWEGDLIQGEDVVFITPTIWEADPGNDFWSGLLQWHVATDAQFGKRAKDVFAGRWPVAGWWFDAISLGIQTAGTIPGIWTSAGKGATRPIGTQRNPDNSDGVLFSPQTLMLTYDTAELLTKSENPTGKGIGILGFTYRDDPHLKGSYTLYLQVERSPGGPGDPYPDLSLLRETNRPEVYVIVGGAKFHVPDPPTLFRLYGGFAGVRVVPDGTLANVPTLPRTGTILREEHSPEVWRIEGVQKRHIKSPQVLFRYGGWSVVRVVPDATLAKIPAGPPIN